MDRMKRLVSALLVLIFHFIVATGQQRSPREEYIEKYKDVAIEKMRTHGIPASITLAQGCLESGDGRSDLAVKANNHFGIKCHTDWKGDSYYKKDDDPGKSCFRKYDRVEDSFNDHSDFLRYRDRYASLFDLDITDYKGWAHGLKRAGYATDPQYAQRLIKIIEDYQLYRFDTPVKGEKKLVLPPNPSALEAVKELKPAKSSIWYKYSRNRTLYVRNGVTYIIANEGDTYEQIAAEYNLFTRELLGFNDLKSGDKLAGGTVVYLEKKKKRAQRYQQYHIAEQGDNFYDLSQRYGIRMKDLLKYNSRTSAGAIYPDEVIHLRSVKK